MSWSREQLAVVESATFAPTWRGYHPDDVERLRQRTVNAMRQGKPLPDLDAMALRRTTGHGARASQVDGLLTTLAAWAEVTPVEDPADAQRREREEELAALAARHAQDEPRWSDEQMDRIREKRFALAGRLSKGYDENDVDDYLDAVVLAMRRGVDLPDPANARFNSAGLRRGYDPKGVDDFLDEIAHMHPEA